jgi:fatty-acyl-CoA synthase
MQHPVYHAKNSPDKPAYIMADSGQVVTYADLADASARGARLLRHLGVAAGEHIAILMENHPAFFKVVWAAQRAGIIFTAISSHLKPAEVAYIVDNCDAKVLVMTPKMAPVAIEALQGVDREIARFCCETDVDGFQSWESALADMSDEPIDDECAGVHMLYSSGTTGSPKGVYPIWHPCRAIDHIEPGMAALREAFRINADTVYLSPAPLYHAAPLIFNQLVQFQGGTSIIMEKFDARLALRLIEQYRVNTAQFVPIMFVRMLKLDQDIRKSFDVSSLKIAIHAAAPCPIEVKRQMLDWWGLILFEYYSSTETAGATMLSSQQWLDHHGSVGLPLGCVVHILDEDGNELPTGQVGEVYFENPALNFEYYKEPEKTGSTRNAQGWVTVGDIGRVDEDGFLSLSDRKNFMIISGGVNIYPQEIENVLIGHPDVDDVAVFGIPCVEFGQKVKAVVQPRKGLFPSAQLESDIIAWCKQHMAGFKVPKSIAFNTKLPRLDNGKLYKQEIAAKYQGETAA